MKTRAAGLSRVQVGPAGLPRVTLPLSVSSCREPRRQGPGVEPRPPPFIITRTNHPQRAGERGGGRCVGGPVICFNYHLQPPPPSSCTVSGTSPERLKSCSVSLSAPLIVFVPVSRQIEFGASYKRKCRSSSDLSARRSGLA